MFDRQRKVLRGRIFQIVVRESSFITTFNVDNIRMNLELQKGSDNFSICAYVFEF